MRQKLAILLLCIFNYVHSQHFSLENLKTNEQIEVALDSAYQWMEYTKITAFTKNYLVIDDAIETAENEEFKARFNAYKASFYCYLYDHNKFDFFLNNALEYYQKHHNRNMLLYLFNLKGVYELYVNNDQIAAIKWQEQSLELILSGGAELEEMSVDVYYNLAVSNAAIKNWEASYDAANKGIKLGKKYSPMRIPRLYYLKGMALLDKNDLHGAVRNFKLAEAFVKEKELSFGRKLYYKHSFYLSGFSEVYKILGDYKKSAEYIREFNKRVTTSEFKKSRLVGKRIQEHSQLLVNLAKRKEEKAQAELKSSELFYNTLTISLGCLIIGVLLVFIFQQRKHEKQNIQKNDLLISKNGELITIKEEVESALKVKTDFLNSITHELRTPLYAINSITHMIKQDDEIKIDASQVDILSFSGDHLLRFINDVIDFNLGTEHFGIEQLKLEKKDFVSLLDNIKKTIKYSLVSNNENKFTFDFAPNISRYLEIDSLKLSRIIINLLNNASKYTKAGEILFIVKQLAINSTSSTIVFCIKDNGQGITKTQLDEIYLAFNNNLDLVKRIENKASGLGIGLVMVNRLLTLYKSELIIDSKEGVGTTVTFEITFNIPSETTALSKNVLIAPKKHKKHILIVDDNKINQLVTSKIIQKQGNTCDVAKGGEEAIAMFKTEINYDFILMDIMMPGMDGFQAAEIIKSIRPEQKIIALTAISLQENKQKFRDSSFEHVIEKPFKIEKFDTLIS